MAKMNQSQRNSLMKLRGQEFEQQQQSFPDGSIPTRENLYDSMTPQIILQDEIEYDVPNQQAVGRINYGSMIILVKNPDNSPKFVLGPHYFMFIPALLLSLSFLIYCLQTFHSRLHFGTVSIVVCTATAFMFVVSYVSVGLSNPGIASTNEVPTRKLWMDPRYCRACNVLRDNKTRHCEYCNVCILEMDHHCVWVGKCIGKNNLKKFKIFIFSTLLTLVMFSVCIFLSPQSKHIQIK